MIIVGIVSKYGNLETEKNIKEDFMKFINLHNF